MTHIQDIFIKNLRYYRTKSGISQTRFSILIDVSPNYYNAIENGKNFPSIDLLQRISNELHILPYQLFLESPSFAHSVNATNSVQNKLIQDLSILKQNLLFECDALIEKIATANK